MYTSIIRPLLFCIDAETIHKQIVKVLHFYRYLIPARMIARAIFNVRSPLFQWRNQTFKNRIGLSAGFDKDASCFDELGDLGFGFIEVGTVTPQAITGNPSPRIFRLPKDHALISRTGFNNPGERLFKKNLSRKRNGEYILGVNINTNSPDKPHQAQTDLITLYKSLEDFADYYTINWGSIPEETLHETLKALNLSYRKEHYTPILLKLPADLPQEKWQYLVDFAKANQLDGFIASGPSQDRSLLIHSPEKEVKEIGAGGISGKPIRTKSISLVKYLSNHAPKEMLIIGAGGIITPDDAKDMLKAGADIIQIYSSFIYEGPFVVKRMIQACR